MKTTVTAMVGLLLCAPLAFAAPIPKGTKAPKIKGEKWIQKGKSVKPPTADAFIGKVVVLEFWAYW